jgi:hypothetical protein
MDEKTPLDGGKQRRFTRRKVLGMAGAGGLVGAGLVSRWFTDDEQAITANRRPRATTTAAPRETTSTTEPPPPPDPDEPDRVLADGEHFPEGFVVPAGETWALADGARITSARNVVVEGTLRMHQPDPSRTMRLTFVDVDESQFVGEDTHEVLDTDVGLWMVKEGRLDVQGAPKTSWTRLTEGVPQAASEIVVEDAAGWSVGDEVAITATASRSAGDHHQQSDRAVVTSVSGNRIGLDRAVSYEHPVVDGRWSAEVINLTRSVVIEGTPDHKAHIIHLHQGMHASSSFRANALSHLEVAHLGPNQGNGDEPSSVLGRYALHWHHGAQTTDGVVVEGVVAHDCGAHAFVPHSSNGMTFRDCASHATVGDAYWWDPSDVSDYVVYERCIASDVYADEANPYKTNGFFAAESDEDLSCVMRNCVATGVHGPDSAGFFWDNGSLGVWVFEDCVAHNNEVNGIRVWQNTSVVHPIDRFTAYNCHTGISHGAYANAYHYHEVTAHDCDVGLHVTAVSRAGDGGSALEFHDVVVTASDTPLVLENAPVDSEGPTDFRRCQFDHVIVQASHSDSQTRWDFTDCGLAPDDFEVEELAGDALLRSQTGGEAWQIANGGQWQTIASF